MLNFDFKNCLINTHKEEINLDLLTHINSVKYSVETMQEKITMNQPFVVEIQKNYVRKLPENLRRKANIKTSITVEYNEKTKKLEISKDGS